MIRIPIRKWEKVRAPVYTAYRDHPWSEARAVRQPWAENDRYRLEVVINGHVLGCDVSVPSYMAEKDPEALRRHVIESLSRQIAAVVADEVRRTIV